LEYIRHSRWELAGLLMEWRERWIALARDDPRSPASVRM